jgi:hypothetical protein
MKNMLTGAGFMTDMGYKDRESKKYENIFVLDTHTTGTIESFNSILLLNNKEFIAQANSNEKRVYEVSEAMKNNPAIHITPEIAQNTINDFSNSIKNNVDAITKFTYIAIAIISLIALIFGSFFV